MSTHWDFPDRCEGFVMDKDRETFWEHFSYMGIDDGRPTKHLNIKDYAEHVERVVGETAMDPSGGKRFTKIEQQLEDIATHLKLMETVQLQKIKGIESWLTAIDKSLLGVVEALQMLASERDKS